MYVEFYTTQNMNLWELNFTKKKLSYYSDIYTALPLKVVGAYRANECYC